MRKGANARRPLGGACQAQCRCGTIKSMILIVTGASGFVGRGLVPALAARGHVGIATGRVAPENLPAGWVGRSRDDVLAGAASLAAIDAIIHLEVKQHVPRPTAGDIADFQRVNVEGTQAWTDWAAEHDVRRFILVSSIKAVGSGHGPQCEAQASAPDTPYGGSKAAGERVVDAWSKAQAGRIATILRAAPVYGPGNEANLAAFVRQIRRGRPCMVGAGEVRKSVVGRGNLCAAIAFMLGRTETGCEIYNVSDAETLSVAALARLVAGLGGWPAPKTMPATLATLLAPLGDAVVGLTGRDFPLTTSRLKAIREESVFPCDKLVAAGFQHPSRMQDGLLEMIEWILAQEAG